MARVKQASRIERWNNAAGLASMYLQELRDVQEEYQSWLDNLPENLQSSALGEKLQAVCEIDLESALEAVQEAEQIDLPLGFGRD